MSYIVGVDYLVLTPDDYEYLTFALADSGYDIASDFEEYTDPTTGLHYYIALSTDVRPEEMDIITGAPFDQMLFGIANFTNSVQANITMP